MTNKERQKKLEEALSNKILILDGAMGTQIQKLNLKTTDFGGVSYEGCNEILNITRPELITSIHLSYLEAGADIIETNSFGATPIVLKEYELQEKTIELNALSAKLAKQAIEKYESTNDIRFIAGSMGPTTKTLSLSNSLDFNELSSSYYLQTKGLISGGVDYLLLETCQDTCNIKAALVGIEKCFKELSIRLPIAISVTIENTGRTLAGQDLDALIIALSHLDLLYLGINCAVGIELMAEPLRLLASKSPFRTACMPNAGLPDEDGNYLDTPEKMASFAANYAKKGWLNLIGGCCGTNETHIRAIKRAVENEAPRKNIKELHGSFVSHLEALEIRDEKPVIIGERCNVIGSKKFKLLINDNKFDEAVSVAKNQVKKGAEILDICFSNPERNEKEDLSHFLPLLLRAIKIPIMIDSTDPESIETALKKCQGKAIINSINLEDGEIKFQKIVPLLKTFGAAIVVGLIDEKGMALGTNRKLEIAKRAHEILLKYGIKNYDIFWDPLVFPCASGDKNYINSATNTINAIKILKKEFPNTKTILGISNVSFGLPPSGRKVLNSVFLHHAIEAGLNLAIVNVEQLERYPLIPDIEKKLSEKLLFAFDSSALLEFNNYFGTKKEVFYEKEKISLNEKLKIRIIEGDKDGLIEDLNQKLKEASPYEIINGPLMDGMDEVGKLFNENKLIVAEVLQSAEVMSTAIKYLKEFMPLDSMTFRGKILLATVKGDVHDIGKNLVDIILSNNGFKVIDLGTKVSSGELIESIKQHKPDIIGLSGLLVRSAYEMANTVNDFKATGINIPVIVGGAALTQKFVHNKIKPNYKGKVFYAKSAMSGLNLAKSIINKESIKEEVPIDTPENKKTALNKISIESLTLLPTPKDFERHIILGSPTSLELWDFVNKKSLFHRHLGVKPYKDLGIKNKKLIEEVESVRHEYKDALYPKAIYQFFKVIARENYIDLYMNNLKVENLLLPRQINPPHQSIIDYIEKNRFDTIALFALTIGINIKEHANKLKDSGHFLRSHILLSLSLELAEALCEYIHMRIREEWGFPDPQDISMTDRFKGKYRGKRYSFGMPSCPELKEQKKLLELLKAEEIGIQLTENYMMNPESSVSGIVIHHPQAKYFSIY